MSEIFGDSNYVRGADVRKFSSSLELAVQDAASKMEQEQSLEFDVQLSVRVLRENPGRIEGYRVTLTPR